jgi:5'-nucleotidase
MQPFGNAIVVKSLSGAQLKALLEQQFASGTNSATAPNMLLPSRGFAFDYDLSKSPGQRIVRMALDGRAIDPAATYRVAVNNFLASGGDNFTVFASGGGAVDAGTDIDALEAYVRGGIRAPQTDRVRDVGPR